MRRLFHLTAILPALPLLLAGCGKKDSMVLDTDDMASLMADIHIGEAVVDLNHNYFNNDSTKMLLKQSIYAAHGVTAEQVDSSYKWYGHHIEDYMEVYDKTIKILNERQGDLLSASNQKIAVAGDSVDIWPLSSRFEFSRRSASRLITFSIPADSTWRNHDVFTLRFNMATASNPVTARMVMEYADGSSYYNLAAGKNKGIGEVSLRVDTTLFPVRIAGYIIARPDEKETVRIDSISLVRMRSELAKKYFSQRPFNYGEKPKPKKEITDSVAATNDSIGSNAPADTIPDNTLAGRYNAAHRQHGQQPRSATPPSSSHTNNQRSMLPRNNTPAQTAPKSTGGGSAAQEGLRKRDELLRAGQRKSGQ